MYGLLNMVMPVVKSSLLSSTFGASPGVNLAQLGRYGQGVAAATLDDFSFAFGTFKSVTTPATHCLKISNGVDSLDIGFSSDRATDGRYYVDMAAVLNSGLDVAGEIHVAGVYCQRTGLYLSQRSFTTGTNKILLVNDPVAGKPAIKFPGAGNNALIDNVNAASGPTSMTDILAGGGVILVHAMTTATPSSRKLFSKGNNNFVNFTSYTSARQGINTTSARQLGMDIGSAPYSTTIHNKWAMLLIEIDDSVSAPVGEYNVDGIGYTTQSVPTAGSGTKATDAANKFAWGNGDTGATVAWNGYQNCLALKRGFL